MNCLNCTRVFKGKSANYVCKYFLKNSIFRVQYRQKSLVKNFIHWKYYSRDSLWHMPEDGFLTQISLLAWAGPPISVNKCSSASFENIRQPSKVADCLTWYFVKLLLWFLELYAFRDDHGSIYLLFNLLEVLRKLFS